MSEIVKLNSFILQQVSFRDLAEHLHECKVTSTADFEWMCRLKYQYTKKDEAAGTETELSLRTDGSWSVRYGFEYYGKNARLVVTPTAERVLVRLFYAMRQWCGGALQGAEGGANLNVASELAVIVGRPIVHVNGSMLTQEKSIVDVFHLALGTSAIACIQFIDRLSKALHSRIGEMMHAIRKAVKAKEMHCKLQQNSSIVDKFSKAAIASGEEMHVQIGIFVQCSVPFSGDHTKLPPTIHSHFRPITVTLPPLELVVRMLLHSEGFIEVDSIAIAAVESIGGVKIYLRR